jgi:hypothetical protein
VRCILTYNVQYNPSVLIRKKKMEFAVRFFARTFSHLERNVHLGGKLKKVKAEKKSRAKLFLDWKADGTSQSTFTRRSKNKKMEKFIDERVRTYA